MSQEPATGLRQRNKQDTRRRILAAARGCLGAAGFEAVTMDEIAAAAEVSRATLFNYFPSKVSILTALSLQFDEQMVRLAEQQRARAVPTSQRIRGMLSEAARSLEAAPPSVRRVVAIMERSWAEAVVAGALRATLAGLKQSRRQPAWEVFQRHFVQGQTYEAIAAQAGCDPKAVDNALQRVKRKIEQHRASRDVPATA